MDVPKEVKDMKLEKGENIARHPGPVTVLKWRDKRNVTIVSTYRSADTQRVSNEGEETGKPLCVIDYNHKVEGVGPPLWSSGQSFWLQIQRSRVRSPALPDFLSSSGSGTGSTQPPEVN